MKTWKWCAFLACLLLTACRTAKTVTDNTGGGEPAATDNWADKVTVYGLKEGTVTSKLNLELSLSGKKVSVGGNCNLKRDEAIQISLVALGFMEVGRVEFTPEYMMMVDRMNRQYVKATYDEVPYLQEAGIDFYTLQALFWNDLFVPGQGAAWMEGDFAMTRLGESNVLVSKRSGLLQSRFTVDLVSGLIRSTSVALNGRVTAPQLNWDYLSFAEVGQRSFPNKMQLSMKDGSKLYKAVFSLNNIKQNAKTLELTAEPGSKYKKVSVQTIMNKLIKR